MTGTDSPRVFAYCASVFGLGHERPTLAILSEISRRNPHAEFLMASGLPLTLKESQPSNFDAFVLPGHGKPSKIRHVRSALLCSAIETYKPDLIYVDQEPSGHEGELRPGIELASTLTPRPRVVAGISDIWNSPDLTHGYWRAHQHDIVAERYFDQLLVFGDSTLFNAPIEYKWSNELVRKTVMCGYRKPDGPIVPAPKIRSDLAVGDEQLLVVTAGGGQDGSQLIRTAIEALKTPELMAIHALIVTGPFMSESAVEHLSRGASGRMGITVARFRSDLPSCLNAADLVVSMAGANTISEIVSFGKRAVVVPRKHQEQELRAKLFAERGLIQNVSMPELTPERLSRAILDGLSAPAPVNDLDFNGLEVAGKILEEFLEPQYTPFDTGD